MSGDSSLLDVVFAAIPDSWGFFARHPIKAMLGHPYPAIYRPLVKCPYCTNPDRNSIFIPVKDARGYDQYYVGCAYKDPNPEEGADVPCVCDGYPTSQQMDRLGMAG